MTGREETHPGSRRRDAVIVFTFTFLLLVLAEVSMRAIWWSPPGVLSQRFDESNNSWVGAVSYGFNTHGRGDLMPGQDGIWAIWPHRSYHVQTNGDGFRNEAEVDDKKIRILAVGDSFTFGPYVANEDTWPSWLEAILNARLFPSASVQVLNAGIAGYTIEDELAYIRDKGPRLNPDLVILGVSANDISDLRPMQRRQFKRPTATSEPVFLGDVRTFLRQHSALYNLARRVTQRVALTIARQELAGGKQDDRYQGHLDITYYRPEVAENRSYWEQYEALLKETIGLLKTANVPLLIVAFPEFMQLPMRGYPDLPQAFVKRIATVLEAPYLDLLPVLRQAGTIETTYLLRYDPARARDETDRFFPERTQYVGNGHMSRFGYFVAARTIAGIIWGKSLIRPLRARFSERDNF